MSDLPKTEQGKGERKSEVIRAKLEMDAPQINRPFAEWSLKEKEDFNAAWPFNNFWINAPGGGATKKEHFEINNGKGSFNTPRKELKGSNEQVITASIASGEHSQKFFDGSQEQLCKEIELALSNSGLKPEDLAELKRLNKEHSKIAKISGKELLQLSQSYPEKFKKMVSEGIDRDARIQLLLLPAALALMDSGYTQQDLSQ